MSSNADATIAALRTGHDTLAPLVEGLPPETLTAPSGCADWNLSQVLSHLGSGAEINLATLTRTLDPSLPAVPNTEVWDRWNAMSPHDRASGFLSANETLVSAYEGLDDAARNSLTIDVGFLPAPVDVATAARLRLNEFALHSWDFRIFSDPDATVAPDAAASLVDSSGMLLGWIGKADQLDGTVAVLVETSEPERSFGLTIADAVAMGEAPEAPDATLTLPAEAWLRLTTGRLDAARTPDSVSVTGAITLDDLRKVFPGY